jgi:hypothetical protein
MVKKWSKVKWSSIQQPVYALLGTVKIFKQAKSGVDWSISALTNYPNTVTFLDDILVKPFEIMTKNTVF